MKTIHNINKWSFITTLILYITIIGGLLAQVVLGFIQFILAIAIITSWKQLNILSKKLITSYWILFLGYWISYWIMNLYFLKSMGIIFYVIVPMSIACYFVCITYKISEFQKETNPKLLSANE